MVGRPIRKRNVTSRDRTGCVTCRARRLKCDEAKPACDNCTRLNLTCGGYAQRIVFKDQTTLVERAHRQQQSRPKRANEDSVREEASSSNIRPDNSPPNHIDATEQYGEPLIQTLGYSPDHYESRQQNQDVFEAATSLALISTGDEVQPLSSHELSHFSSPTGYVHDGQYGHLPTPSEPPTGISTPLATPTATSTMSQPPADGNVWPFSSQSSIEVPPSVPPGLLESSKFAEDMIYYHHLRDGAYGQLATLGLSGITDVSYLDGSFFHAALALSALEISRSNAPKLLRSKAALHALDHFVEALGTVGRTLVDGDQDTRLSKPNTTVDAHNREKAISWLSTVLFLALFELQRGQMRLWYVHSCAAVDFLSQHLSLVVELDIGESLIRCFSRIAALLDIFDRTHSVKNRLTNPAVSHSLVHTMTTSPSPYDRLLFILPRVNELEEDWRAGPRSDPEWDERVNGIRRELKQWRQSLEPCDVPVFDDEEDLKDVENPPFQVKPFAIHKSKEPVRAATNIMHYISSLVRLDFMYPPGPKRMLTKSELHHSVRHICRLAAGVPYDLCATVNAYGHGMLPVLMNVYHITDDYNAKGWIMDWIAHFPRDREGIWNVRQMHRLLAHVEEEYGQNGPRAGWSVIKCRMVDLEVEGQTPGSDEREPDKFCVEIYARGKKGWAIDFVEIN